MNSTRCPDQTDLTAFALGKLPTADFARVAGHVEQCPACDTRLQELDDLSDVVVDSLGHLSTDNFNRQTPPAIIELAKAAFVRRGNHATARRMEQSCVDCHNVHPDSTKRDWKPGDVRGVLEIIRTLDQDVERTRQGLRGTYILISSFLLLLGASVLVLVAGNKRRSR